MNIRLVLVLLSTTWLTDHNSVLHIDNRPLAKTGPKYMYIYTGSFIIQLHDYVSAHDHVQPPLHRAPDNHVMPILLRNGQ